MGLKECYFLLDCLQLYLLSQTKFLQSLHFLFLIKSVVLNHLIFHQITHRTLQTQHVNQCGVPINYV